MIRVAILGASGYSALELIRILLRHPEVEITALTTRKTESPSIGEVHPSLAGRLVHNKARPVVVQDFKFRIRHETYIRLLA